MWRDLQHHRTKVFSGVVALLVLLSSVGVATATRRDSVVLAQSADEEVAPGPHAAWDTIAEEPAPADRPAPVTRGEGGATAAPSDCFGQPTRRIRYTSDGVIHLEGCGQTFTLTEVAAAPAIGADKLELVDAANKIWLLKVNLKVEEGATLQVVGGNGGDARWLRLRSDAASGIWLRAERGNILFLDTKVTSWDTAAQNVDTNPAVNPDGTGGRSYIATRSVLTADRTTAPPTACNVNGGTQEPYEARMNVINSEVGYLGYNAPESYGIVWKVYYKADPANPADQPPPGRELYAKVDVFGEVTGSKFHHNYFGSYTFGAYCMNWSGNVFEHNAQYGLDPHDDSDFVTIKNNIFRDNGNHGVICSVECSNLVIVNNEAYRNLHGIMIHRNVNNALIEGNTSADNRAAGIAIFDSHEAVVRKNTVRNNGEAAIRLSVGSSRNLIEGNTLTSPAADGAVPGYVIYTFKGTDAPTSGDGMLRDNVLRGNTITANKEPFAKIGQSIGLRLEGNSYAGAARSLDLNQSTGLIVRDMPVGTTLHFDLDPASTASLLDVRGMIWQTSNGLATTAEAGGSSLNLTAQNGGRNVNVTAVDLAVRPAAGALAVKPTQWGGATRTWSESGGSAGSAAAHDIGGLEANACYAVTANGKALGQFKANAQGRVQFSSAEAGDVVYNLAPAATCTAAPTPSATTTPMPTQPGTTPSPTPSATTTPVTGSPTPAPAPLPYKVLVPIVAR